MDTRETSDAKASTSKADTAYDGTVGRTRMESVHVTIPSGTIRSLQVYVAVNVETDPELREPALTGALHRFAGGEELAIPFVFHDPSARKLAVVLPPALRHRELHERARLLLALAEDAAHPIPTYAREARVVIGMDELRDYLGQTSAGGLEAVVAITAKQREDLDRRDKDMARREVELTGREQEHATREGQLGSREQRLKARAEEVTRREDEVRTANELIETQQRDLELREQALEERLASLKTREVEVATREQAATAQAAARPKSVPPSARPASAPPPAASVVSALERHVEEIEGDGSDSTVAGDLEPIAATLREPTAASARDEDIAGDVEEIVDEDDVEELDEADVVQEVTGVTSAERAEEAHIEELRTQIAQSGSMPKPTVVPPASFVADRSLEMAATFSDGVWLFARLSEGHVDAFREGTDSLSQLVLVQGYPVVVLTLLETREGRPYARRAALDPRKADHRRVLAGLRHEYEATVALFGPDGRFERTVEVAGDREANVALLLERIETLSASDQRTDGATAAERALAAPPPTREAEHPFDAAALPKATDAAQVANTLARLVAWRTPEKMDRVLLALSVPKPVVDECTRRILEDALEQGLALTPELSDLAVSVGLAADQSALVTRLLSRFHEVADKADESGLGKEDIADNWAQLLDAAGELEVAVDAKVQDDAWRAIRHARGDTTGNQTVQDVDLAKLPDMGKLELLFLLDHPKARTSAALELCRRSDPEMLDALYKAVRRMPRPEVVRIVPRILEYGEVSGDVLIDGLGARKTFVRQASALGLGELKLRRAVVPLMHGLVNESSEVWRELARIIGSFGSSAFRQVARTLKEPRDAEARLRLTLAHLANHGCDKMIDKLTKDPDKPVATMALEALALRHEARAEEEEILGKRPWDGDDPIKRFSKRFYQELAGTAPSEDLDG